MKLFKLHLATGIELFGIVAIVLGLVMLSTPLGLIALGIAACGIGYWIEAGL